MRVVQLAAVSACLLSSGCLYDGSFLVRGTVTDPRAAPVAGASIRLGRLTSGRGVAATGGDGSYEVTYWYGGMFPFSFGTPDPGVEITAPGFRTHRFPLKSAAVFATGEAAARCAPLRGCYLLDLTLVPEDAPASR